MEFTMVDKEEKVVSLGWDDEETMIVTSSVSDPVFGSRGVTLYGSLVPRTIDGDDIFYEIWIVVMFGDFEKVFKFDYKRLVELDAGQEQIEEIIGKLKDCDSDYFLKLKSLGQV